MSLFDSLRRRSQAATTQSTTQPAPTRNSAPAPEDEVLTIPEITPAELMAAQRNGAGPVIVDCRESYERKQARIPGSLHIPMNETPLRLGELDRSADIVVVCAHGSRSYAVTGYLVQHGFRALSLAGGMAAWQSRGGEIESDYRSQR